MHLIEKVGSNFLLFPGRRKWLKFFLLMKLSLVFVLAGTLCVSANGFTQQNVTLHLKNATLQQTFREIQRQTGFTFLYTKQMVENASKVNIEVNNVSMQDALNECLKKQLLDFSIENKTVIIRRRRSPASNEKAPEPADTLIDVKGIVLSETSSPLQGATIRITALGKMVNSNAKGEFVLNNMPKGKYRFEVSYVGFDDYVGTIEVNGNTGNIVAALKQVLSNLDEVQVIAYGTSTKRFNTGDQGSVKSQDIEKQPVTNPLQALQGRMAGVLVTSASGVPGSGISMQIRGNYSLSSTAYPLYIVDGVPVPAASLSVATTSSGTYATASKDVSPLNSINPMDIENITVLKDADATAIYGSRGSNGVVLITTKRGKAGKTKFEVNALSGSSKATRIPEFLNTQQYREIRKKAFAADNITPGPTNSQDLSWDSTAYTNFPKMILGNTAPFSNVQTIASGGNESTRFLLSLGYHNEGSIIFGNNYDKRVSGHINVDHYSANKKFNINTSITYTNDNIKTLAADPFVAIYAPPNFPHYDSTGALYWIAKDAQANTANPWSYLNRVGRNQTDNLIASTSLKYTILPGLNAKVNVGFTKMFLTQQVTQPTTSYNPTSTSSTKSLASFGNNNVQTYIIEPQIDYARQIGDLTISALAGGTAQSSTSKSNSITGINFSTDDLIETIAAVASTNITYKNNTSTQYKYISGFGRLNFRFMDKYILNGTFRRDGSSRFGPGKTFGNFWSIGAGWIFSQEDLIRNAFPVLSFGKLRASYGTTGSDQIGDYRYLPLYASNTSQAYNGNVGIYANQIANPNFSWEENKKLEAAIELGFVKDRILLTAAWYRNRSANQLVQSPLPTQTGQPYYQANLPALVQMTSWEFELSSVNINYKDFRWQTVFNLTLPDSKLLDYPNLASSAYSNTYEIGKPLRLARGYHYTGLSSTGVPQIEDINKDGSLSSTYDYYTIGSLSPQYYGGMGNTFSYKGFSLDIFVQFTKQNGYSAQRAFYFPPGYKVNVPTFMTKDYWEASNTDATQPALTTSASSAIGSIMLNRLYISNYAFVDASYARLKNLSFSYSLPRKLTDKISAQNVRIYIQGQNLITVTKYEGLDPETQNATPVLKTLTGGIQLTF